jgi:tetratricopeptide (TPR) repeat protein
LLREQVGLQRFRNAEKPENQAQVWFEAGRLAAGQGNMEEARRMLRSAVQDDPDYTGAWLQLAWLTEDPQERVMLLRQVLALEPDHAGAQAEMERLEASSVLPDAPSQPSDHRLRRWGLALLVLAAALFLVILLVWGPVDSSLAGLLPTPTPTATPMPTLTPGETAAQFEPQLQAALTSKNWGRALEIVTIMLSVDPSGEAVLRWGLNAHMQYGKALVQAERAGDALEQFDLAVALVPGDAEARLWQEVTQMYITGQEAMATGDWQAAIDILTQAHSRMPEYADLSALVIEAYRRQGEAALEAGDWTAAIKSLTLARERSRDDQKLVGLLASAYRNRGIAWQEEGELQKARTDLESALALLPDDEAARTHYDEVMYILFPPKRIEVNISTQRFYAWEGDRLVYQFLTSTGLPDKATAAGNFKVQSKIPNAYSSIWRLHMPYWLGIYNVGRIENGIHALPIRPDGSVMWGGLLGQRASYGCVILSTAAARLIYEWADIGTPVHIHY